jgi:colicin import membrane protein
MNSALAYPEPTYRFSAGILALAVHLAFFTVLYFGIRWQSQPVPDFTVEMWDSLPDTEVVAEAPPLPVAKPEPVRPTKAGAPVTPMVKADIELHEKKKKPEVKEKPPRKKETKQQLAASRAKQEDERRELEAYSDRLRQAEMARQQAEHDRVRAEVSAAMQVQVNRYEDLIRSKIQRKRKAVADVPESAEAIFKMTLLPDGTVMDAVMVKSSGFPAYDDAVERAIRSASPLPLPTDVTLQKMFREIRLSFRP